MSLVPLENYQSEQHQDVWENLKFFSTYFLIFCLQLLRISLYIFTLLYPL